MAFDWKKTLGTVAPGIANMLGGPLAGMATSAVLGFFGVESTGDPGKDEELISLKVQGMTPEQAVQIKAIEADLAKTMKQAGVDIYKIEVEDRKSARDMRTKLGGDFTTTLIAVLVVAAWGLINYFIFTSPTELPNRDIIMRTLGTLDGALLVVLYFFFGSSKGSSDKNRLIAEKMDAPL